MVSMKTKPESELYKRNKWTGRPDRFKKNAMAQVHESSRIAFSPQSALPLTVENLIIPEAKVIPLPSEPVTQAASGVDEIFSARREEKAYQAWLEAFTTFYHDDRLYRIEHGTRVDETGKIRTKRTTVAKQFVTWLLPGDHWGATHPDGTARLEGDYPTRDQHEKQSDRSRYVQTKVVKGRDLTLVPREAWSYSMSKEKVVPGFETWSRPPSLGELFAQNRKDVESYSYIIPVTWHQQWLNRTLCYNQLDASSWGPTPQEREGAPGNRPINPVARQYRLSVEEPIPSILDEHVKTFEMLNTPSVSSNDEDDYVNITTEAINDLPWEQGSPDLAHYGTPISDLQLKLEIGKEIVEPNIPVWIYNSREVKPFVVEYKDTPVVSNEMVCRIPVAETPLLLPSPPPRNPVLVNLEVNLLRGVVSKAREYSEKFRYEWWLASSVNRGDPYEHDPGYLKAVKLIQLRAMFKKYRTLEWMDAQRRILSRKVETPNCVIRPFPRCSFVDDSVRYNSWWLTAIASDGIPDRILVTMSEDELIKLPFSVKPYKHQGVTKRPYDFVTLDNEKFKNSFEYWVKMVKMGRSPIQALRNVFKRIGKLRASDRAKIINDRPKPLADNITLQRRSESSKVTERIDKAPTLLNEYSPKEIAEIIGEDLDRKVEPVIGHLIASPKFQERSRLDNMLKLYENTNRDIVSAALCDGIINVDSLADNFSMDSITRLYLPTHLLECTPADWKRMGFVSEPRITLLDKVKNALHLGTEK